MVAMTLRKLGLAVGIGVIGLGGCARDVWSYRAVPDINISRPNQIDTKGALVLKTEPANAPSAFATPAEGSTRLADPSAPSRRTVLVANWQHESAMYHHDVARTLVIFLDGQPRPGQYWLTPDNAVLLTFSAYSAPERVRVNLTGSIRIDQVHGNQIVADVAVRDTTEIDTSLFFERPFDPMYQIAPFVLYGTHTFAVTDPNDPLFAKAAVKWVAQ